MDQTRSATSSEEPIHPWCGGASLSRNLGKITQEELHNPNNPVDFNALAVNCRWCPERRTRLR